MFYVLTSIMGMVVLNYILLNAQVYAVSICQGHAQVVRLGLEEIRKLDALPRII